MGDNIIYAKRIALIGHSAAGKSACLAAMGIDGAIADMDCVLGTKPGPTLPSALAWLAADTTSRIVVLTNHEETLREMAKAKAAGQSAEHFDRLHLVYLHKPKDEVQRDLERPTAGGVTRPFDAVQYTLDHYDGLHKIYGRLADVVVDCSQRSTEQVAAVVRAMKP